MNQNNRFCSQQGHECFEIIHICTYRECDMRRWCCHQCISDEIHRHSMPDSNHIMNQENFSNKVKQDIENLRKEYQQSKQRAKIKSKQQQMVQEVQEQVIDNQISDEEVNFKLQQLQLKLEGINLKQLNDEDINELLYILQLQDSIEKGIQQQNILEQNEKQYQENNKNKILNFKSREYDIQKVHETNHSDYIYSSLISTNEQFLVYNVRNLLTIYDLKMNKIYKTLIQKWELSTLQFTIDSELLFAGDIKCFVYGYFLKNGFKRFYKQQIHKNHITQLIVLEQYLITASFDQTIIKTNFINKNQIFKLIAHPDCITCIDYDGLKDIMISLSIAQSLKLWDCKNQIILIDYPVQSFDIGYIHIQLINNKQDILKCDQYSLKIFAIDYQMNELVQTYSYDFNLESHIGQDSYGFSQWDLLRTQRFQSINNDQNLLLIWTNYCIIFNKKGDMIVKIYHGLHLELASSLPLPCYRHQLDNLNYIILQDCKQLQYKQEYKLYLLRAKDKN